MRLFCERCGKRTNTAGVCVDGFCRARYEPSNPLLPLIQTAAPLTEADVRRIVREELKQMKSNNGEEANDNQ